MEKVKFHETPLIVNKNILTQHSKIKIKKKPKKINIFDLSMQPFIFKIPGE